MYFGFWVCILGLYFRFVFIFVVCVCFLVLVSETMKP